jgi:HD-GYP domain-containing protein (c-di-GMP phosphodiesterase class II)
LLDLVDDVAMKKSDPEIQLDNFISVGAAYAQQRDTRTVMGMIFTFAMTAAGATIAIYATIAEVWDVGIGLLIALTLGAAVFGAVMPWARLKREWQLSMFWIALVLIDLSVYVLDVPTMTVLILLPMMGLTYWFGRDRTILISHMLGAVAAFAIPVLTGDTNDAASALIITLPAMIAVAALSGVLADRFHTMRSHERGRYKATIEALSTALTARDGYTGSHSQETLWFVRAVAEELRLSAHECEYVADVALLHDIGKIGIPNEVLHEPGRLNDEQWEIMKQHPVIGETIVKTIPGLEEVARAIRHEHEHWNGGGYPDGLRQGEIPLASRIVLVCDAFHAMTSDRPYREAMSVSDARLELSENAGTQFDPQVVGALLHVLDRREPGDNDIFAARIGEPALSPSAL